MSTVIPKTTPRNEKLLVKRLSKNAVMPVRVDSGSAGMDLSSASEDDIVVPARGRALIPTDLAMTPPFGCYIRLAPRSGLALKNGLDVGAGVGDFSYTSSYSVILFNHTDKDFIVKKGDRIAQMIITRIEVPEIEEVKELVETDRKSGFGSTGVGTFVAKETTESKQ
jgi:dUTP pyrophosphatase